MYNLFKLTPSRNITHQWIVAGLTCLLATPVALMIPLFGFVLAPVLFIAFVQFMHAATKLPFPSDVPLAVRKYEDLMSWWNRFSKPLAHTVRNGEMAFIRKGWDYAELYDKNGIFIGSEQEVDWSMTDLNHKPGMHRQVNFYFKPAEECAEQDSLSFLALRRSRAAATTSKPVNSLLSDAMNFAKKGTVVRIATHGNIHAAMMA